MKYLKSINIIFIVQWFNILLFAFANDNVIINFPMDTENFCYDRITQRYDLINSHTLRNAFNYNQEDNYCTVNNCKYSKNNSTVYCKEISSYYKVEFNISEVDGNCEIDNFSKFNEVKILYGINEEKNNTKWEYSNKLFIEKTTIFKQLGILGEIFSIYNNYYLFSEYNKFKVTTSSNCTLYLSYNSVRFKPLIEYENPRYFIDHFAWRTFLETNLSNIKLYFN